jgi:hypothetical protein
MCRYASAKPLAAAAGVAYLTELAIVGQIAVAVWETNGAVVVVVGADVVVVAVGAVWRPATNPSAIRSTATRAEMTVLRRSATTRTYVSLCARDRSESHIAFLRYSFVTEWGCVG